MSNVDMSSSIQSVLAQMRAIQAQATQLPDAAALAAQDVAARTDAVGTQAPGVQPGGFANLMREALDSVNALQMESAALSNGFVRGEHEDMVATAIAGQKSSLAFQGVVTARNRMVAAYQDIMNMPI